MAEGNRKLQRALGALRDDVWSELQHRRVAKRVDEALATGKPPRRWARSVAALAVVAACAGAWLILRAPSAPPLAVSGATLGSDARAASAVLVDGSLVDIERGGRIRIVADRLEETRVEVLSGRAEFEVKKRPGRPFFALIHGVEVRVVGTHFSTELDLTRPPGVVRVAVQRGTVEVRELVGERVARLSAGDAIEISLGTGGGSRDSEPTPSASAAGLGTRPDEAPASATSAVRVAPAVAPDASKLFEAAHEARRAGDVAAAVRAYAALIKQFPGDERVGVAALELGRLRMDALHAYGPAADAFRRAIAAAPNEGIREDALARLIEALAATGDRTACLREQHRYQERYPRGVHAAAVANRCASRK